MASGQIDEQLATALKQTLVLEHRRLAEKGAFFPNVPEFEREEAFQDFLNKPLGPASAKAVNNLAFGCPPSISRGGEASVEEASESCESETMGPCRIEYTDKKLLSLRQFATFPPKRLAQLSFLPPVHAKEPTGSTALKEPPALRLVDGTVQTGSQTTYRENGIHSEMTKRSGNSISPYRGLASSRWAERGSRLDDNELAYEPRKGGSPSSPDFTLIAF